MGNHPSSTTSKHASEHDATSSHDAGASRSSSKGDPKNIAAMHTTGRAAAPPEESLASATRSNVSSNPKSLPQTITSASPTGSYNSPGAASGSISQQQPPRPSAEQRPIPGDAPSKPVAVPIEPSSARSHHNASDPPNFLSQNSITDMSYLTRPPRLPLPIEEELHTPGSPIIAASDAGDVDDVQALDSDMTRKSSALSGGTSADDEEDTDGEGLVVDRTRPTVPTTLRWLRGGEKVYVTGTIFQWNRKHRLQPAEGHPGVYETTISILPGTHHIRFLVDGVMQTSPDLPTTVDFGNNLVNYIEVSPDDVRAAAKTAAAKEAAETSAAESAKAKGDPKPPRGRAVLPADHYRLEIPQYLVDLDLPDDSPSYQHAYSATEKLTTPPALPGFLGKPILNATTPIKDDNSVLNLPPNHAVLNHLATSSIKNNVLAVSATTRYKNKYVTTIVYKPTGFDA